MEPAVQVSVVIAAHNSEATLAAQLDALARQAFEGAFEVVVADNGSTDGTADLVSARHRAGEAVRLVDASERRGPAHARNVGARDAHGELLLFCDSDDVADEGWIAAMVAGLEDHDGVGGHLETGRINPVPVARMRPSPTAHGLPVAFGRWPVPIGASCGIVRSRFVELDGFDEAFPAAGGEDTDLFIRLHLAGGSIGWVPNAVMHYRLRPEVRATWRQARTYGAANAELRRRFGVEEHGRSAAERAGDLAWMAKCLLLSPVSRRRRGELVWWIGHEAGRITASRGRRSPSPAR